MAQAQQMLRRDKEQQEEELNKGLREADLKTVLAKLERDFVLLESTGQSEDKRALETSKDMKYLRDRQKYLELIPSFGAVQLLDSKHYFRFAQDFCQQFVVPRQGEEHVDAWMAMHCELQRTEKYEGGVPAFLKFKEQFRGASGKVHPGFTLFLFFYLLAV